MSAMRPRLPEPGRGSAPRRAAEVFHTALQLGLTSFGGPIAHLGYFERTYVQQRRWLTSEQYGNVVALCQLLPGPTSSQVGFLIGLHRAGWPGAFGAWAGFTAPSALLMYWGAILAASLQGPLPQALVHGLQLVAVGVVAQAVVSMAQSLCRDALTVAVAVVAAGALFIMSGTTVQIAVLIAGAVSGMVFARRTWPAEARLAVPPAGPVAWCALGMFGLLLIALPVLASLSPRGPLALTNIFYRAGALVFGGGHVVLPLLGDALVPGGWITNDRFLTGYGLAQAMPGPLFTVATYLGAANVYVQPSVLAALIATVAIFLPGLLVAVAGAALWGRASRHAMVRTAIVGINAAVVGILGAALYHPVISTAIHNWIDAAIALAGFVALVRWKLPPIALVAATLMCSALAQFAKDLPW